MIYKIRNVINFMSSGRNLIKKQQRNKLNLTIRYLAIFLGEGSTLFIGTLNASVRPGLHILFWIYTPE